MYCLIRKANFCSVAKGKTSVTSGIVSGPPILSKRAIFRAIPPDMHLVNKLDAIDLGFCAKKRRRIAVAIKLRSSTYERTTTDKYTTNTNKDRKDTKVPPPSRNESPFPFNFGARRASKIRDASEYDDVPLFDGQPPEVAIIGRSNVGKSTLLNALLGFNSHIESSKVTAKPGETKQLKLYSMGYRRDFENKVSNPALIIADMPGYGFAFMNEEDIERCHRSMISYLRHRGSTLKRVLLIVDARHGIKLADIEFFKRLAGKQSGNNPDSDFEKSKSAKFKFSWKLQIVFTKCDMVERMELARRVQVTNTNLSDLLPGFASSLPIVCVSGKEKKGILDLQREISALVPPKVDDPSKLIKYQQHQENSTTPQPDTII